MRHGVRGRKFGRNTGERKALLSGLALSLLKYEQIRTTLPKAKDLRPFVEKLITIGKQADLAARRRLVATLGSDEIQKKTVEVLGKRYAARPGGYTRIIKAGYRYGDRAPMAVIELIDRDLAAKNPFVSSVKPEIS
ncbi:MAG: 50S ribosomal protein L17 [Alphaproteobacteria bacterium]